MNGRFGAEGWPELTPTTEKHVAGGNVYTDPTGLRWWVLEGYSARQMSHAVAAAALYNAVGVLAPSLRMVRVGDRARAVHLEPRRWHRLSPEEIRDRHAAEVERTRIADTWLRNTATIAESCRFREEAIPGLPGVLRLKLTQTLGYRGIGRLDPGWEAIEVPAITDLQRPLARAIGRLSQSTIRSAVEGSGLTGAEAISLWGTLITRQEAIRVALG